MISKVLVAIDHTAASQNAMLQASILSRSEGSRMVLVSVIPPYEGDLRMLGRSEVLEQMQIPFIEALQNAERTAEQYDLKIKSVHDEGEPFSRVLQHAEAENVDLIVFGGSGHNPIDRLPVGTTTNKMISQSPTDILVIPKKASINLDRILVAFDDSDASQKALNRSIDLSLAYGSELTLVTVFDVPLEGFVYSPKIWDKEVEKALQLQRETRLSVETRGVRNIKTIVKHGKAAKEISDLARSIKAGLIVVGWKPVHTMKKYLMGNVVEKLVHNDSTPVWVCKK